MPVASPGHKLGQIIGTVLQDVFRGPLMALAQQHGLYCDSCGPRAGVRTGKKVTWCDLLDNTHDLDYVLERGGDEITLGRPAAFIEIAWRRYTKHSRNKSGEIEGALLPLRDAYPGAFLGVVVAGNYSGGGLQQLRSQGIHVLEIPFETMAGAFAAEGVQIDYPERATQRQKTQLNRQLERLTSPQLKRISERVWNAIRPEWDGLERQLVASVSRVLRRVRIVWLYGQEMTCHTFDEAIEALKAEQEHDSPDGAKSIGLELHVEYSSGSTVTGRFVEPSEAAQFLRQIA